MCFPNQEKHNRGWVQDGHQLSSSLGICVEVKTKKSCIKYHKQKETPGPETSVKQRRGPSNSVFPGLHISDVLNLSGSMLKRDTTSEFLVSRPKSWIRSWMTPKRVRLISSLLWKNSASQSLITRHGDELRWNTLHRYVCCSQRVDRTPT